MSSEANRAKPLGLRIAAIAGLLFLHLPLALIVLYAFTTEERSFQFPPPGYTTSEELAANRIARPIQKSQIDCCATTAGC